MKKLFEKIKWGGIKPGKAEWIILILSIVVLSCCYMYTDLPFTFSSGLRVWNCIAEGHPELFYWSSYPGVPDTALAGGSSGGSYDFLIYFIFAVYGLPIWIWEKITGYSFIMFFITRVYAKGILWLFSGMAALLIYKIAELCGVKKENAVWAPFLFLSSGIFFAAEVSIGGYDIISTAFALLGVWGYLKKNSKCFYISFAVAIASKLFAFWLFVPLLLLKEKKIWKLCLKMLGVFSAIIIPKIYFSIASREIVMQKIQKAEAESGRKFEHVHKAVNDIIAHSNVIDEALFPTEYTAQYTFLSLRNFPLVFAGMFLIWILCYLTKRELNKLEVIYLCTLVMSVFITTVKFHPYWGILLVPYLAMLLVLNPGRFKINILLETLISIGYVINKAILYKWCFSMQQIERMAAPQHLFGYDRATVDSGRYGLELLVYKLCEKIGIGETNIAQIFSVLFVVSLTLLLYYNRPQKNEEQEALIGETEDIKSSMFWRFVFSLFVGILPMIGLILYCLPVQLLD